MIDVVVPKWGLTMDEARVVQWMRSVGDSVIEGEPLCEIETDKAVGEVNSPANGVLVAIDVEVGSFVEPSQRIARIEPN
jgi:2-oxoglutarate dehydrogenase E2 component (dihydrolipoamide succinyltransferase)